MSNEQLIEFDTFVLDMNGKEIEFAITEEFDFEGKHYILCGEVIDEEVNDEEVYLFRAIMEENDITVESIDTEEEYNRNVEAYYEQNVEIEEDEE